MNYPYITFTKDSKHYLFGPFASDEEAKAKASELEDSIKYEIKQYPTGKLSEATKIYVDEMHSNGNYAI